MSGMLKGLVRLSPMMIGCQRTSGGNYNLIAKALFFDKSGRDWEKAWEDKNTPWETGKASPGLKQAMEEGLCKEMEGSELHALVPGCGSGFDVDYLRSLNKFSTVTGLDLSSTAVDVAMKNLSNVKPSNDTKIDIVCGSYFDFLPANKFDIIFDYTFFVALDIPLRQAWGDATSRLLKKESGILITKMFPLFDATVDSPEKLLIGPPYPVRLEDYESILVPRGFKLLLTEPVRNSIKPRRGKEQLGYWKLT